MHSHHFTVFLQLGDLHLWHREGAVTVLFFTNMIFLFIANMYDAGIRQAANDLDKVYTFLQYGMSGFLFDVIIL